MRKVVSSKALDLLADRLAANVPAMCLIDNEGLAELVASHQTLEEELNSIDEERLRLKDELKKRERECSVLWRELHLLRLKVLTLDATETTGPLADAVTKVQEFIFPTTKATVISPETES